MRKKLSSIITNHEILEFIIGSLCHEFKVHRRDMLKVPNSENILLLMAIVMAIEISSLSKEALGQLFGVKVAEVLRASRRLNKYFRFIPGLQARYDKIKTRIIKKADEF